MKYKRDNAIELFEIQKSALRDPAEIVCGSYVQNGIQAQSLRYLVKGDFISLLEKSKKTLLITREYEHLVIALCAKNGRLRQSFLHLPHPSGVAVDKQTNCIYIAATRNPNQIFELAPAAKEMQRSPGKRKGNHSGYLMPTRTKLFPGGYYFHDLAVIGSGLYANCVGKNGVIKVNFNSGRPDKVIWSPLPHKMQSRNHIQLNSIAAGATIFDSFFSASADKPGKYKPGHLKFPVDKTGVIFSARSKKVIAHNLTRPHSAKLYKNTLWVNNSGYGEFGAIRGKEFVPLIKFPGWTRGLCLIGNIAMVGVSRVIPAYQAYAPGISKHAKKCGVFAVDIRTNKILGSIEWPFGNQIFGIDAIDSKHTKGFIFTKAQPSSFKEKEYFFRYTI